MNIYLLFFIILFALATGFFIGMLAFKDNDLWVQVQNQLEVSNIPVESTSVSCKSTLTSSVYALHNPDDSGISGSIQRSDSASRFTIHINEGSLTIENYGLFDKEDIWNIISNDDMLVGNLLLPKSTGPANQEFYTLFLDRTTGQGIINQNRLNQYINRQVQGHVTHISCSSVE